VTFFGAFTFDPHSKSPVLHGAEDAPEINRLINSGMFSFVTGKGKVSASWVEGGIIAPLNS
jgi:hypothetical protein